METILKTSNEIAVRTKQLLNEVKRETEAQRLGNNGNQGEAIIRDNITRALLSTFLVTADEYVKSQKEYKADIEREIALQVLIRKRDATSEEIEAALINKSRGQAAVHNVACYVDLYRYPKAPASYTSYESTESIVEDVTQTYPDWAVLSYSLNEIYQSLHYYFLMLKSKEKRSNNSIEDGYQNLLRDLMDREQPKDFSRSRMYHILRIIAGVAILAMIVIIIVYLGVL